MLAKLTRIARFVALVGVSYCVMTVIHECGHMVCGLLCGGRLTSFEIRPWKLPFSLFEPNPIPIVTLWGGPILGVLLPLGVAWLLNQNWAWFIGQFCQLGNGSYLAIAWLSGDRYLDTPMLLEHGASPLSIGIYCLLTIGFGYVGFKRQCVLMLNGPEPVPTKEPTE